jgi:hypothetical protein
MDIILYITISNKNSIIEFLLEKEYTNKKKNKEYYNNFKINRNKISLEVSKYSNIDKLFYNNNYFSKIIKKINNGDYLITYYVKYNDININLINKIIEYINFHNNYEFTPTDLIIKI